MTLSTAPADMTERLEANDNADVAEHAEPIDRAEQAEPTDPIEQTEPTDPIESTDPSLAIERTEPRDHSDQREDDTSLNVTLEVFPSDRSSPTK